MRWSVDDPQKTWITKFCVRISARIPYEKKICSPHMYASHTNDRSIDVFVCFVCFQIRLLRSLCGYVCAMPYVFLRCVLFFSLSWNTFFSLANIYLCDCIQSEQRKQWHQFDWVFWCVVLVQILLNFQNESHKNIRNRE